MMRVLMGLVFMVAAAAFLIGGFLAWQLSGAPALLPSLIACFGLLIMVLIGLGAILEDEIKQSRAVLIQIRERLPR